MRRQYPAIIGILAIVLVTLAPTAGAVPKKLAYRFYMDGQPIGRADIRVTQSPAELRFESKTRVEIGPNVVDLSCKTLADPKTYAVREFTMEGTKGGSPVAAHVTVLGDSVHGYIVSGGNRREKAKKSEYPRVLLFEDWIMELEILLAQTQAASKHPSDTYGLVFAGSFLPADITAGYTSDVLVEAGDRSMAARKLEVVIRGSSPFFSHVDPIRGVPVYLDFPAVRVEAFLEEVFGENPATRYSPTPKNGP